MPARYGQPASHTQGGGQGGAGRARLQHGKGVLIDIDRTMGAGVAEAAGALNTREGEGDADAGEGRWREVGSAEQRIGARSELGALCRLADPRQTVLLCLYLKKSGISAGAAPKLVALVHQARPCCLCADASHLQRQTASDAGGEASSAYDRVGSRGQRAPERRMQAGGAHRSSGRGRAVGAPQLPGEVPRPQGVGQQRSERHTLHCTQGLPRQRGAD